MVVEIIVLDSDNDLCSVFEAGFTDPDGDKLLGELLLQLLMLMELLRAALVIQYQSNYIIAALLYSHLYLISQQPAN
jgi:hypothetical protein